MLDDAHRTIKDQCVSFAKGPPLLPPSSASTSVITEIHGIVVDGSGKPVAGAEVRSLLPNVYDATNSKGEFIIPVASGDGKSASITVSHPKFKGFIGAVKIDGTPIKISLNPR